MFIAEHTIETKASREAIWKLWADVENWNKWDHGLEYTTINGPFVSGTTGTLKPKGGPLVPIKLTHVTPLKSFYDEAKLPLTKIIMYHDITEKEGKRLVNHRIEMKGLLAFFFAFVIGRDMKKNLAAEMQNMVNMAESKDS